MEIISESEKTDRPREGMDDEHGAQIQLLDQLIASLSNADGNHTRDILDQFIAYTDAHFMSEGLLMRLYAYPQYEHHLAEHDSLMQEAKIMAQTAEESPNALRAQIDAFRAHLAAHIAGKDEALGRFLAKHNKEAPK